MTLEQERAKPQRTAKQFQAMLRPWSGVICALSLRY